MIILVVARITTSAKCVNNFRDGVTYATSLIGQFAVTLEISLLPRTETRDKILITLCGN